MKIHHILNILFIGCLSLFTIYSYALIDPNLTLINHPLWISFRDPMVQLGYLTRPVSSQMFVSLLVLLFLSHHLVVRFSKGVRPMKIAGIIGLIVLFSYPLFSHDLFNYIFDAKILTYYGQNPYTTIPGSFPQDEWIRFMHWTHRSYPYGPTFLPLTLIPSFLGMGKFILNFIFFKSMFVGFYLVGVYVLQKMNKRSALIFATHPFVIIEGLINSHNDLIAVSLGLIGLYLIWQKRSVWGRIFFLFSAGIKYLSAPILLLTKENKFFNVLSLACQIGLILYLCFTRGLQPWYFLPLFVFIPLFPRFLEDISIFLFGLILSYYPYVLLGDWNAQKLDMKHDIIVVFLAINVAYLVIRYRALIFRYLPKK